MNDGEYEEALGEVEAMVQRSIDYWKAREDTTDSVIYVDAYHCIQKNIKTIKDELLIQSSSTAVKDTS